MEPLTAVVAIVVLFVILTTLIARAGGLTFLAPKSTEGIRRSVEFFCVEDCRVDNRCPLGDTDEPRENCPLWKYVRSDAPTVVRGRPVEAPHAWGRAVRRSGLEPPAADGSS